ncbi:MAG: hypothetical protein IRY99_17885 [Isosphaeraceae bacterium]|nr:hypothetical protein [Isosphaeraceae bacterium]
MPDEKSIRWRLPKFPIEGRGRSPFRRKQYLDGTIKVYFGPGQKESVLKTYTEPEDWPPAGALLRPPQVVWLSCPFPLATLAGNQDPYGDFDFDTWDMASILGAHSNSLPPEYESVWISIPMGGGADYYREDRLLIFVDDTPFREIRSSLKATFEEVEARIKDLRKGKTWVVINPWLMPPTAGDLYEKWLHMVAPGATDFFGTDFLHIYIGHPVMDALDRRYKSYRLWSSTPGIDAGPYGGDKSRVYQDSRGKLAVAYPKFIRHRVMLYGHNINPPDPGFGDWRDFATNGNNRLMEDANDLSGFGFSYEGTGDHMTADDLMEVIGRHYHFDPQTGAPKAPSRP